MNSQQFAVLVDTDLVSQTVNVECAPARTIGHAVVVAADGDQTFMAHASLEPDHTIEHAGGQRLQRGRSSPKCCATTRCVVPCTRTLATASSHSRNWRFMSPRFWNR